MKYRNTFNGHDLLQKCCSHPVNYLVYGTVCLIFTLIPGNEYAIVCQEMSMPLFTYVTAIKSKNE
jgi:hypothetical protein